MFLVKTAVIALSVYLLYRLAKFAIKKKLESMLGRPIGRGKEQKNINQEKLVPCAACGTFVAEEETRSKGGHAFCCPECMEKGPADS